MLSEANLAKVRALDGIARARGQTLAQLALSWALRSPTVTSALIGASSVSQLEGNLTALEAPPLSEEELADIDRYATDSAINIWQRSSTS